MTSRKSDLSTGQAERPKDGRAGSGAALARALVATLPASTATLFNSHRSQCDRAAEGDQPSDRIARLASHIECQAKYILCGEAPSHRGQRLSGVAFTSERLLLEGKIPRIRIESRLSTTKLPFSENSATIVWRTLYSLGIAEQTVLWNSVQLHPHKAGDIWSNRTPTFKECQIGLPAIEILRGAFPEARWVAVGNRAATALECLGIPAQPVRHPSMGDATKFAEGLAVFIQG